MAFSSRSQPPIRLELSVEADDPSLLVGLDTLVQLNWISDAELRQLAATQLTCAVLDLEATAESAADSTEVGDSDDALVWQDDGLASEPGVGGRFIVDEPETRAGWRRGRRNRREQGSVTAPSAMEAGSESDQDQVRSQIQSPVQPPRWAQITQSLMAELSVVWLLCIGVVLVVLSSALLAASQWSRFSAAGQYGVLLAYTLVLGGSYYWTSRQVSLQLTTRTLLFLTLLLVPVNFWAMDQLNLWQSRLGIGTIAIATIILAALVIYLYQRRLQAPFACTVIVLGLGLLQWGWQVTGMPLLAVYGGAIAGTLAIIRTVNQDLIPSTRTRAATESSEPLEPSLEQTSATVSPLNRITLILLYAFGLLVLRVLFTQAVAIEQISLALGIVGWGLGWLVHRTQVVQAGVRAGNVTGQGEVRGQGSGGDEVSSSRSISSAFASPPAKRHLTSIQLWGAISGSILVLAWLMAVLDLPWQALVISGLGLHLVSQSLRLTWTRRDLSGLILIGVQVPILIWQCFPDSVQTTVSVALVRLTQVDISFSLWGIVYLPYVALIVGAGRWLKRRQRQDLVTVADWFAIGIGVLLTLISLLDPLTITVNLIVSTVLLGIITQRHAAIYQAGIYATQAIGMLAIASLTSYLQPSLPRIGWIGLVLGLAVVEWIWSQGRTWLEWRRSGRLVGAALAAIAYLLFVKRRDVLLQVASVNPQWQLLWLVIPLCLTTLAVREMPERRQRWAWASTLAIILLPPLTFEFVETRSHSFLLATGLMVMNTVWFASRWTAGLTVGFGLAFGISVLWDQITARPLWVLLGAIAVAVFWLIWTGIQRWTSPEAGRPIRLPLRLQLEAYAAALDLWAIGLSGVLLLIGTADAVWLYLGQREDSLVYVAAFLILLVSMIGRTGWSASEIAPYVLSWSGELLLAELVHLGGGDVLDLAIANSALGAVLLIAFSVLGQQRTRLRSHLSMPLLFGLLAVILRVGAFTAWTGWLSVVAALIGVGVGRQLQLRALKWMALIGLTLGWYELVLYQLAQAEGGSPADGMVILALVAAVIMGVYRLLQRGLVSWLAMAETDIQLLTHLHWAFGLILMVLSAGFVIESGIELRELAIAVGLALVIYPLEQGRLVHWSDAAAAPTNGSGRIPLDELWVYVGLMTLIGLGADIRLMAPELRIVQPWLGAIAGALAILIYSGSWRRWGWSETPWRHFALILPVGMVITSANVVHPASLAIAAVSYVLLARQAERIRLTYLSVALIDWLIWRQCDRANITDPLAYVVPLGLSLIYIAQVDPALRASDQRLARHLLRLLGIGVIFLTAFLNEPWSGLPLGIASLVVVFVGLALRTRAWLYTGTIFLGLTVIDQLIVLNSLYPFVKWLIGIGVGSLLIWVAATFETRREQVVSLVQDWGEELETWS